VTGCLRRAAAPFVAAAPAGARVRARLRLSPEDEAVLRAAGAHLGSLAGEDLAARCAEGRLDARGQARSRAVRKRALTAASSSRWAGAITRTSEDQHRLAVQNLRTERASLQVRIRRIQTRLAVPAGLKTGGDRGYATAAERYAKTVRLQKLQARLAAADRRLEAGTVSVVRGGKALLRKRGNLAAADLTQTQWREQWESARLFLTADGEKDKAWGNETIRWNPDQGWLEIKLPGPLAHLANRPHGRYRLAYTSRWGREHWLAPLQDQASPIATGHHAAAVVIGRRALGHRARRRAGVTGGGQRTGRRGTAPRAPVAGRADRDGRPREAPAAATLVAEDRDGQTDPPARPGDPGPFGAAGQSGPCPASSVGTVDKEGSAVAA
jgi:hypothetical protein